MSTITSGSQPAVTQGEPRPVIQPLAPFYEYSRDLSYLVIRLTAGGMLLVHGINKLMTTTVSAWAANSLARRGIEPALPLAYVVWFLETVGAVCIMLGLFTRFFATAIGIQFLVITFIAHWPNGFGWSQPRGGWEYPLFWGLIILAIGLRGGGPYSLDRKLGWEL
ncbi:MAG: DoxX family protein [Xanthobacteraceae bacterium]|jgi:putative oxidoreductase